MVIVKIYEGLGNQLFRYAYARALIERGYEVKLDIGHDFDKLCPVPINNDIRKISLCDFNISIDTIDVNDYGKYNYLLGCRWKDRVIKTLTAYGLYKYKLYEEKEQHYVNESYYISDNVYAKGWFQSERYFQNIRSILLKELSLKKEPFINDKLSQLIENNNSVCIHVRRGDYVKLNHALNKYYYYKAIEIISQEVQEPVFVVFSDNIEWAKRNIKSEHPIIFSSDFGEFTDSEELIIMSRFKNIIISNSTYSWWSAWLNDNKDKIVIAPNNYSWFEGQFGIVAKGWTVI